MSKLKSLTNQFISNLKTHKLITDSKRNLILSILKSTTTKREAKNYLNKYQNQFDFSDVSFSSILSEPSVRDRQRELFVNRFLSRQNPFTGIYDDETKLAKIPLRLAIFKVKFPSIPPKTWQGMTETLKRLVDLGISPVIVLDFDHVEKGTFKNKEQYIASLVNKIVRVLDLGDDKSLRANALRSMFIKNAYSKDLAMDPLSDSSNMNITVGGLEQILIPLYQGIIPIIQPIVYNAENGQQDFLSSNKLLSSLCAQLVNTKGLLLIEKIIMIDPLGGIPSVERNQTSHVYINLSQEFADIVSELYIGFINPRKRDLHLENLNTMNDILHMISAKSGDDDCTGIITTPYIMSINNDQLNPIIYNVLTDRPVISSSLPSSKKTELSTSILKKGVPVTILDKDNYNGKFTFTNLVKSNLVDEDRLLHLINDSFGRQLNAPQYIQRINESLATVIIVGDYDGAAIITWENTESGRVAYLDKFAIAKKNQGLPGLADVIFKSILQSHPNELIWRSRNNNPVNKWYFQRCRGSISVPESQWKIFYTGEIFNKKIDRLRRKSTDGVDVKHKIREYVQVAEGIPASFD